MNIIQLHDRVLGHIDQARSGMIHPTVIDAAVNASIDGAIKQRIGFENIIGPTGYYPLENARIKNSIGYYMQSHVLANTSLGIDVYTLLSAAQKPACKILTGVRINIGSISAAQWITPIPVNAKDAFENSQNTFTKPQNSIWQVVYFSFNGRHLQVMLPSSLTMCQIELEYIRVPGIVDHGILVNALDYQGVNVPVIGFSSTLVYNGKTRFRGEQFNIAHEGLLTEGEVVKGFSEVDIDPEMIEEVVLMAARQLSATRIGVLNESKER